MAHWMRQIAAAVAGRIVMEEVFTCALCGQVYLKGWAASEANKEAEKYFGVAGASERPGFAVVCDDCFEKIHPAKNQELVDLAKAKLGEK